MGDRTGDWIWTFSGLRFWPLDPRPGEIRIEDIAHALAHQCRFGGHSKTFYSVAEHSVRVSRICSAGDAFWGLLHDASEAYLQDVTRPLKRLPEFAAYRAIEAGLQRAIALRFGLAPEQPPSVTAADDAILAVESRELLSNETISNPLSPDAAERLFLARFRELTAPAPHERIIGCDFGAPSAAAGQRKKIILIEAERTADATYSVRLAGRNQLLCNRRQPGRTVKELIQELAGDSAVTVAAFDFPFGIPTELLNSEEFAKRVHQMAAFGGRPAWQSFVSNKIGDSDDLDYGALRGWWGSEPGDTRLWIKRACDRNSSALAPLKHMGPCLINMTLAGAHLLHRLSQSGFEVATAPPVPSGGGRFIIEAYPSGAAIACGGPHPKKAPQDCLEWARRSLERKLRERGGALEIDPAVLDFCREYATGHDHDGVDAFLCLATAIAFREGFAKQQRGAATEAEIAEEGCILIPCLCA